MEAVAIIPARMAATRFPGKPLADICGRPMVQWVYERAAKARRVSRVLVATCDDEIARAVESFGGEAVMTSPEARSGTDRLAEAAAGLSVDVVVNVQGDEPLIDPDSIDRAIEPFEGTGPPDMVSLMVRVSREEALDPNLVKVVVDAHSDALYFSRCSIPYDRAGSGAPAYGHIGLYAYTRDFLLQFASLPQTKLEISESLEQLRALEHGYRIRMVEVGSRAAGVDTPEDLEQVRAAVRQEMEAQDR